ncbi:hypothetical protein JRC19_21360 [Escherichia coli]|uniref:hypothetical protein n=1 Tax=Escherichia coli TaxID=562 RepID=UPI00193BD0A2|nr:hypothetical protein [Escherichia coli]MBM2924529.1 hypothetical protein [Escherichia coli]
MNKTLSSILLIFGICASSLAADKKEPSVFHDVKGRKHRLFQPVDLPLYFQTPVIT